MGNYYPLDKLLQRRRWIGFFQTANDRCKRSIKVYKIKPTFINLNREKKHLKIYENGHLLDAELIYEESEESENPYIQLFCQAENHKAASDFTRFF